MILVYMILLDKQEQEISIREFTNLIDSNCFKEVLFVEEEYFYSKNIKSKKVEGVINNQIFYCYVNSFDQFYDTVAKNGNLSYRNERRSGLEFPMQKFFLVLDTISLAMILGIILVRRKKGGMEGMGQMGGIKNKKFEVTKNVTIKFNDVAGLH